MGGTAGTFYRQFGLYNGHRHRFLRIERLDAGPALCAIFLKPHNSDAAMKERIGVAN